MAEVWQVAVMLEPCSLPDVVKEFATEAEATARIDTKRDPWNYGWRKAPNEQEGTTQCPTPTQSLPQSQR